MYNVGCRTGPIYKLKTKPIPLRDSLRDSIKNAAWEITSRPKSARLYNPIWQAVEAPICDNICHPLKNSINDSVNPKNAEPYIQKINLN